MENIDSSPSFGWKTILLPIVISVGVSAYLMYAKFDSEALRSVHFSSKILTGLLLAVATVIIRDLAYMWRIRAITGGKLSWYKSFEVIMLWEFGSAVTPGAVGGIALALFVLKKEGISYGRSTATIMLTTFLDNLAFVLVFGGLYLFLGEKMFLVSALCDEIRGNVILEALSNAASKSILGWGVYAASATFFGVALFVLPNQAQRLFSALASINWLGKISKDIKKLGADLSLASVEFRQMPVSFFAKNFLATLTAWISRYALANALLFAFASADLNQLEVFARQYVLWIFVVIPSTPGASGLAELSFIAMNCEYIKPGLAASIAVIWRLYSYYLYLAVGAIVLPKWWARVAKT